MIRMAVEIRLHDIRRYQNNLNTIEQIVQNTAANIEGDAKQTILISSGQYKPYPRGTRIHWSSPPGTPPNNDYGNLANSFYVRRVNRTTAEVKVGANYGALLEIGGFNSQGIHVAARPFLLPAVRRHERAFFRAIRRVLGGP